MAASTAVARSPKGPSYGTPSRSRRERIFSVPLPASSTMALGARATSASGEKSMFLSVPPMMSTTEARGTAAPRRGVGDGCRRVIEEPDPLPFAEHLQPVLDPGELAQRLPHDLGLHAEEIEHEPGAEQVHPVVGPGEARAGEDVLLFHAAGGQPGHSLLSLEPRAAQPVGKILRRVEVRPGARFPGEVLLPRIVEVEDRFLVLRLPAEEDLLVRDVLPHSRIPVQVVRAGSP